MRLFARACCYVLLGAALGLAACATVGVALMDGALAECSSAPHCVSSLAQDERHHVEPFVLADPARGWARLEEIVAASERTRLVVRDGRYLHAEVVSPWHFYTDDLELVRGAGARVDVRSSSRIGYYDFQVNRKRVEALRRKLLDAGVITADGR